MPFDETFKKKVRKGNPNVQFLIPEPKFRYGMKNKPSTPIDHVLSNL